MPTRTAALALALALQALMACAAAQDGLTPADRLSMLIQQEQDHEASARERLESLALALEELERSNPEVGVSRKAKQAASRVQRLQEAYAPSIPWGWYAFGLAAQVGFFCRFLVQWLASERAGKSVVPVAFWWLSIVGSLMLLNYAVFHLRDPIIILGQSTGLFIYTRNLVLLGRAKRRGEAAARG